MWEEFLKVFSSEGLADEFSATPEGGSIDDDKEVNESNEQFNESNSNNDFNIGELDGFDTGDNFDEGGGFGDSGLGNGGNSGLGTSLKPTENPFKGQNGRTLLDTKLSELYVSVDNALKLVQSNIKVDKVVIAELTDLLRNIKQVRDVVFIQPIETTMFRWALCVKAYQLISKQLCINKKTEKKSN